MASFNDAFASARKKFESSGSKDDFTFDWNGKKYNVLRKGETKRSLMDKHVKSDLAPKESAKPKARPTAAPETSKRPKSRAEGSAPKTSARPKARPGSETPKATPKETPEAAPKKEKSRFGLINRLRDKVDEQEEPKKKKVTEYKDDEKAARSRAGGTLPDGYNRVRIPGMAKGGSVATPGQFKKSGSPRGYK